MRILFLCAKFSLIAIFLVQLSFPNVLAIGSTKATNGDKSLFTKLYCTLFWNFDSTRCVNPSQTSDKKIVVKDDKLMLVGADNTGTDDSYDSPQDIGQYIKSLISSLFKEEKDSLRGDKGDTGYTGSKGDKGDKGEKGDEGEDGDDGSDGASGSFSGTTTAHASLLGGLSVTGTTTFSSLPSIPLTTGGLLVGSASNLATPLTIGSSNQILTVSGGTPTWMDPGTVFATTSYLNGGNSFSGLATLGTNDAYGLALKTNGTTRMTLNSSGNIGIGTTSPGTTLQIGSSFGIGPLNDALGDLVASTGMVFPSTLSGFVYPGSAITSKATGNYGGILLFGTRWMHGNEITERMRITDLGNVGIGTSVPTAKLQVVWGSGSVYFLNDSTGLGDLLGFTGAGGRNLGVESYGGGTNLITDIGINYALNSGNGTQKFALIGAKKAPIIRMSAEDGSIALYGESGTGVDWRTPTHNMGLYVSSDGNVGIGTTSPSVPLHIVGEASFYGSLLSGSGNAGGITIKQYTADGGGWPWSEISGTRSSIWTAGKGLLFRNDTAQISTSGDFYVNGNFSTSKTIASPSGFGAAANSLYTYADATNTYITSIKYGSAAPYPPLYVSAPTINFNTKTGAAWADGAGGTSYGTTRMTILDTGNVGIGTTAPTAQLHLVKADSSALTDLLVNPSVKTSGNLMDLQVGGTSKAFVDYAGGLSLRSNVIRLGTTGYENSLIFSNSGSVVSFSGGGIVKGSYGNLTLDTISLPDPATNYSILFKIGSVEKARIDGAGNVGIGTTSPTAGYALDVIGDVRLNSTIKLISTTGMIESASGGNITIRATGNGGLQLNSYGSTQVTGTVTIGTIFSNTQTSGTKVVADINPSFAPASGTAIFNNLQIDPTINQTGGASGISRGLYINPTLTAAADWRSIDIANNSGFALYQSGTSASNYFAGNVGIGTTSPGTMLQVGAAGNTGNLTVYGTSTTCTIGDGVGATNCSSDLTLKKDITNYEDSLSSILQLQPVTFRWKDENKNQGVKLGLIAQDVESVFPEFVNTMPDGTKGLDYAALVAPLIGAVKDQQKQIDDLKALSPTPSLSPTPTTIPNTFTSWINNVLTYIVDMVYEKPVKFLSSVTFQKQPEYEDGDVAGIAVIKSGQNLVKIDFVQEMAREPIVQASPLDKSTPYFLKEITKSGFTIALPDNATSDTRFNWSVVKVSSPRTVESAPSGEVVASPTTTPTPQVVSPTATPDVTVSPTPTGAVPTETPSPTTTLETITPTVTP